MLESWCLSRRLAPIALAGLLGCASKPSATPADLVVYGRVWTGDSARPWAGAVASRGETMQCTTMAPMIGGS